MPCMCVRAITCVPPGCCQNGEPVPPNPPSPAAARRLFDLDCADGSQPTECQVGDRVDTLSGFGGEYIVVI